MIFFASVPFGPGVNEYMAWLEGGGGREIYDEEYAKYNIKGLQCGIVTAETAGWFRQEIETLDELKGLKMRFFGLGAKVMQKMGVSTQLLAGPDIYPALERGVIDAAEYSYPSIDQSAGFYQIAKHNYFPGWHQQSSLVEIILNMEVWNGLSAPYQKMLEIACNEANMWMMAASEARQADAIAFHESEGVTVHRWSDEQIATFRSAWEEVAAEEAAADPNFKRIYEAYAAFRQDYAVWRDIGYLKQ
jgi:TRAP-type mannitol/chloroaromatic compound transport system substrate-binding protein